MNAFSIMSGVRLSPLIQHKDFKTNPSRLAALAALVLGGVMLLSSVARADIPLSAVLESRLGRYLLMQTREGEELLSQVIRNRLPNAGQVSRSKLLELAQERLSLPEFAAERNEIESRLHDILRRFDKRMGNSARGLPNRQERRMLDRIAASELRVSPEWRPRQQDSEFFDTVPRANFKNSREAFTKPNAAVNVLDDTADVAIAARPAASREVKGLFSKMKTCVANSTPTQMDQANFRYLMTQLAFDETITLGGIVTSAGGIDDIDLKSLPSDLFYTAVASMGDSWVVGKPGRFSVRWFRLVGAGAAESAVDMMVYQIRQHVADAPLEKQQLSTGQRFAYNTGWGALYAPVSIGLYKLVIGLECIHTNAAVVVAVRAGVGVAGSYGYYSLRKQVNSAMGEAP